MFKLLIVGVVSCFSLFAAVPDGMYENLYFVNPDLKGGTQYSSVKYKDASAMEFQFDGDFNKKDLSYIRPENHTWKKEVSDNQPIQTLYFNNTASYGWLQSFKSDVFYISKLGANQHNVVFSGNQCIGGLSSSGKYCFCYYS